MKRAPVGLGEVSGSRRVKRVTGVAGAFNAHPSPPDSGPHPLTPLKVACRLPRGIYNIPPSHEITLFCDYRMELAFMEATRGFRAQHVLAGTISFPIHLCSIRRNAVNERN